MNLEPYGGLASLKVLLATDHENMITKKIEELSFERGQVQVRHQVARPHETLKRTKKLVSRSANTGHLKSSANLLKGNRVLFSKKFWGTRTLQMA